MRITFLGTGTSTGVPMLTCSCGVCVSTNPKNQRLRSSVLVEDDSGRSLLIDCSTDFRQQALRHNIVDVDHILITHVHADHVFGLDELRIYNQRYAKPVNLYLELAAEVELREVFKYAYQPILQKGGGVPELLNHIIEPGKGFALNNFAVTPIRVNHGLLPILGFRVNNFVYITDCSSIPQEAWSLLQNVDTLVLNALREREHPTHFSLEQAIENAQKVGARQTFFTHIAHDLEHEAVNKLLPEGYQLAYDGLVVKI